MKDSHRVVLDLLDRRPIWALPHWAVTELREALPTGWELVVVQTPTDGSGDGSGGVSPAVLDAVPGARIYVGFGIPEAVVKAGAPTLEWVHSGAAGVGSSLHGALLESRIRFTNSAGIHGPPMAETVVGMLLHFARGFDFAVAGQREGLWNDPPFLAADTPVMELSSMTVGILGYGGIGREVGRRLRALGSRVIGLRRTDGGGADDEFGVQVVSGEVGMTRMLGACDALVVAAPDTPETRGIVSAERIRTLKRGAVLVNVARGRLVDEEALVEALRDGHLRGAGLDVFWTEPLPAEHPLWSLPNVLVTPHTSAVTRGFWRRQVDLIVENLRRFLAGSELLNEVDRSRGY